MDVLEALLTRRSIRRYKKDPVPQEVLQKVLEAGRWAPSASNSQPWDFIVFTEPELKKQLARAHLYGSFLSEAPLGIAVIVDPWQSSCPVQDGTLAAYSMWLAAHALGLGACWINPGGNDAAVRRLLDIPDGKELVCVLSIGYPAQKGSSQRRRLRDIVHIERYGNRAERQSTE
jgi:nitroreductase